MEALAKNEDLSRSRRRMIPSELYLAAAVGLAFAVEASIGFGATVVAVTLGALFLPIDVLLPAFVPVNMLLSASLFIRNREQVRWDLLGRRVLPFMAMGLPVGMLVFTQFDETQLRRLFGLLVATLSIVELWRMGKSSMDATLSPFVERMALLAGGVVHGAFATGGPLAVFVSGRVLSDKAQFRATLSVLWLLLNTLLVIVYGLSGKISGQSLGLGLLLFPSLFAGMALGEWAHRRIPMHAFRVGVFGLLLITGILLVIRG